ncbi:MAG: multicopper oxidase domain-containing protein [Nitrospinae bacterium]|nr:multicopper oxidase domain-containing protein [Nitrospinota bacterium]
MAYYKLHLIIRMARIKDKKDRRQKSEARRQIFCPLSSVLCLLFSVLCLLSSVFCLPVLHAEEILKTSKVKVGEKAPLTDSLKKPHDEGKAIVLLLLSNPMQCEKCEEMAKLMKEETEKYKDSVAYVVKGGQDILGAVDEDTSQLKKLYGFVTIGQPWTFFIDKQGFLQKIFFGQISSEELNNAIQSIIEKKVGQGFSPANIKEFTFVVTEGNIELNGTKFMVWKYNDSFPGPEIRVKEGDTVRVKLQNKSSAKHGMFFHGLHVSPKVAMQEEVAVAPDYEYIYEFVAKPSGTHFYHCSYNMAEHLDRGMYGAFIVEGKDDEKFDKEFIYIIDDWNSKAAKGESHHEMGHPRSLMDYDITTINGKTITNNPAVIEAKAGEKIKIRLINAGSLPHALRLPEGFVITHEDSYPLPEHRKETFLTTYGGQRHDIVITPERKGKLIFYHSINFAPSLAQKLAEPSHLHKHDENHPAPPDKLVPADSKQGNIQGQASSSPLSGEGQARPEQSRRGEGDFKGNKEEIAIIMEVK